MIYSLVFVCKLKSLANLQKRNIFFGKNTKKIKVFVFYQDRFVDMHFAFIIFLHNFAFILIMPLT